jgi:uncharacterized protein (UPF0276 family)
MGAATGIGLVFNSIVPHFLAVYVDTVDYVEVIPETLWTDRGRLATRRYEPIPAAFDEVDALAERYPIACHGIGLSIGSASALDEQHLAEIRRFADRYGVDRISEHFGFSRVRGPEGDDHHLGLAFPIPCDNDILSWMIGRIERAMGILGQPIILENGVHHTPLIEQDMTEPEFLNRVAEVTGCGVLLDLHNLHADHRNGGPAPLAYIEALDLEHVREIHIAGGSMIGRTYTDSHAGPCPPEVWDLLVDVAPRCPLLEGITFEFHDSYFPRMGSEGLCQQLQSAREIWAGLPRRHDVT